MTPKREWLDTDYYAVLGVADDADQDTIKKAYRKLARENHPDANPDTADAETRFKDIGEAYAVLGKTDSRTEYDKLRRLGAAGLGGMGGGFPGGFQSSGSGDLSDVLRTMFEQGGGGGGGGFGFPGSGRAARPRQGRDYEADISVSFTDALVGVRTRLRINGDGPCDTCHGSGAAPGTSPTRCATCGGSGQVNVNQGPFSFAQPCTTCGGNGQVIEDPCTTCGGTGRVVKPREVTVKIPAGVKHGAVIRLPGRGGPGVNGGRAGDVLVHVTVEPDERFGRKGDNVTITMPISYPQAVLGDKIAVPTPMGESRTIRIPAGTTSGSTFRIRKEGADKSRGRGKGDLLVTVDIDVPSHPSREQKDLLKQLQDMSETGTT